MLRLVLEGLLSKVHEARRWSPIFVATEKAGKTEYLETTNILSAEITNLFKTANHVTLYNLGSDESGLAVGQRIPAGWTVVLLDS